MRLGQCHFCGFRNVWVNAIVRPGSTTGVECCGECWDWHGPVHVPNGDVRRDPKRRHLGVENPGFEDVVRAMEDGAVEDEAFE